MAKTLTGVVSSDATDKTIVVTARTRKTHTIYKKQYTMSRKYMAHDEQNEAHVGDKVVIAETRPLSARKRYTLLKVIEKATIQHVEPESPITTIESPAEDKEAKTRDKRQETTSQEEKS